MSLLPQHKYSLRSLITHNPTCPRLCPIARLTCSATTTTKSRSSQNQLVIEPRLATGPDPITSIVSNAGPSLPNDTSLQSTWSHQAWVASGCTTLLISLAKAITSAIDSHMWLEPVLAGYVGYIVADLLSGVYHWGIDNYGDASTPVFGSQIEGFQGHHKWPWTITRRQFANNLHALARSVTFTVLPINILCNDPLFKVLSACVPVALCLANNFMLGLIAPRASSLQRWWRCKMLVSSSRGPNILLTIGHPITVTTA